MPAPKKPKPGPSKPMEWGIFPGCTPDPATAAPEAQAQSQWAPFTTIEGVSDVFEDPDPSEWFMAYKLCNSKNHCNTVAHYVQLDNGQQARFTHAAPVCKLARPQDTQAKKAAMATAKQNAVRGLEDEEACEAALKAAAKAVDSAFDARAAARRCEAGKPYDPQMWQQTGLPESLNNWAMLCYNVTLEGAEARQLILVHCLVDSQPRLGPNNQYRWQLVDRHACSTPETCKQRRLHTPLLWPKQANRNDAPGECFISIMEACGHVQSQQFRIVTALLERRSLALVGTSVGPPFRVNANNDSTKGRLGMQMPIHLHSSCPALAGVTTRPAELVPLCKSIKPQGRDTDSTDGSSSPAKRSKKAAARPKQPKRSSPAAQAKPCSNKRRKQASTSASASPAASAPPSPSADAACIISVAGASQGMTLGAQPSELTRSMRKLTLRRRRGNYLVESEPSSSSGGSDGGPRTPDFLIQEPTHSCLDVNTALLPEAAFTLGPEQPDYTFMADLELNTLPSPHASPQGKQLPDVSAFNWDEAANVSLDSYAGYLVPDPPSAGPDLAGPILMSQQSLAAIMASCPSPAAAPAPNMQAGIQASPTAMAPPPQLPSNNVTLNGTTDPTQPEEPDYLYMVLAGMCGEPDINPPSAMTPADSPATTTPEPEVELDDFNLDDMDLDDDQLLMDMPDTSFLDGTGAELL